MVSQRRSAGVCLHRPGARADPGASRGRAGLDAHAGLRRDGGRPVAGLESVRDQQDARAAGVPGGVQAAAARTQGPWGARPIAAHARGAREPWVLAVSLAFAGLRAEEVVRDYARRMQIEESFRDLKDPRHGAALRHALTRKAPRMEILILLHALASVLA
ncbi:transposase [Metallibacterium sp.]